MVLDRNGALSALAGLRHAIQSGRTDARGAHDQPDRVADRRARRRSPTGTRLAMSAPMSGCPAARISRSIRARRRSGRRRSRQGAGGRQRSGALRGRLHDPEAARDARAATGGCSTTTATAAISARCSSSTTRGTATLPITLAHAGNGFFMRRGYAVAWLAWEGDMLPGDGRMVLDVPVATDNGKPITGRIRVEYIADAPGITCFPLSGRIAAHSYATVSLDTRDAVLTRRRYPYDTPQVNPRTTSGASPRRSPAWAARRSRWNALWCRPHGTSICRPASSPAGSMSLSIRRRIRWCMASAMSRCATSSAS